MKTEFPERIEELQTLSDKTIIFLGAAGSINRLKSRYCLLPICVDDKEKDKIYWDVINKLVCVMDGGWIKHYLRG